MVNKNQSALVETIHRLFYDKQGQMVVSALFGIALALIFRRVCKDNCIIYYAPTAKDVDNKVFKLEDTCYKYNAYAVKCDSKNENIFKTYDVNIKPDNQIIDYGLFSGFFS
jgi:hypothetical protein